MFPFYCWDNWDLGTLSNLPRAIQPKSERTVIWTWAYLPPKPMLYNLIPPPTHSPFHSDSSGSTEVSARKHEMSNTWLTPCSGTPYMHKSKWGDTGGGVWVFMQISHFSLNFHSPTLADLSCQQQSSWCDNGDFLFSSLIYYNSFVKRSFLLFIYLFI